jgi:predicted DNA-binding mobile mystery protein A
MSIREIVIAQYQSLVNRAAVSARELSVPKEGWIRTVRKALGMSGAQLARRLGVTRALVSNTERAELSGSVTIKAMEQMARAMDCKFVYAIVPDGEIQDMISQRAREKALAIVERTNKHMALEAQTLSKEQIDFEIRRLQRELVNAMPSDLWND